MFFLTGPPAWPESPPDVTRTALVPADAGLSLELPLTLVAIGSPAAVRHAKAHPHPTVYHSHDPALVRAAVAHEASRRTGSAARLYYPQRPRLACASFVSKVLVTEGLLPRKIASVASLRHALLHRGWALNCPYGTSVLHISRKHLLPGDVLLFHRRGGRLAHSGISLGGDRFVAISSSHRRVALWRLSQYSRVYPDFESVRYDP